ncbi:MAG TPA: hypothetical protein VMC79_11090 [Rectinemataceae bacterium]|nr:hypothetical protein [Rectinemataceae bacterium]
MNKSESSILESKTPEEYIDRSLKAKLSPAAKARLARMWMESTGYSKEDILRARNRHPYWKRKKMEGSAERTRRRLAAHDYSSGSSVDWSRALVTEFLGLNKKDSAGRYDLKDWQLAEHFGATIPSIQYMRRKLRKVQKLLGARAPAAKIVEYLLRAESVLSRGKDAVEDLKKAEKVRERGESIPRSSRGAKPGGRRAASSGAASAKAPRRPAKKGAAPKAAVRKGAASKGVAKKTAGKKNAVSTRATSGRPAAAGAKVAAGKRRR